MEGGLFYKHNSIKVLVFLTYKALNRIGND